MKFPSGNEKLREAIERWENASSNPEKEAARNDCCLNCPKILDCDECYIGKDGENNDWYAQNVPGGLHGDFHKGKDGKYRYNHRYGGG